LSNPAIEDKEFNQVMILQPHLIKNLQHKFGNEVLQTRTHRTPGTPRFRVIHPDQDSESQSRYHSGFGMLLSLTNLRADIFNVVRELCQCMDGITMGTYLEMVRVIKFFLDKENFRLKIRPKFENKN
jgi:hypothetical protein